MRVMVTRPLGILLRGVAIIVPILLFGVGLLYLRLLYSPVSVPFLAGPIERGLNAELPGFAFGIGDAVLQRSDSGGIEFRLKTVRMNDSGGSVVALARLASVELNLKALLGGRIAPSRIDLIEPRFLLFYDEQGHLALKPPSPEEGRGEPARQLPAAAGAGQQAPVPAATASRQHLEVARLAAETLARVRRDGRGASYLEGVGLRNATLILDEAGRQTVWRIGELDVDLQHKQKRSIVAGRAEIASAGEPWHLEFRAEESEKSRSIVLEAAFENLVPSALVRQMPGLGALAGINVPLSGKVVLDVTLDGSVASGRLDIDAARGSILLPGLSSGAIGVEQARLALRYSGEAHTFELLPSPLTLGIGSLTVQGRASMAPIAPGRPSWRFEIEAKDGALAESGTGQRPILIERLTAAGQFGPGAGQLDLEGLVFKAGGAEIEMATAVDAAGQSVLQGRIGPMSVAALRSIWPATLAPRARSFLVQGLRKGSIRGGTFRVSPSGDAAPGDRRLALSIEAADVEMELQRGVPALEVPRALLRIDGTSLELTVPDAAMGSPAARRLTLRGGRLTVVETDRPRPMAEIVGRVQGPLTGLIDILERYQPGLIKGLGIPPQSIEGKLDAPFRVTLPLGDTIVPADVRYESRLRIADGRIKDIVGTHDITGASITVEGTEKALDVKGELLLAGVVAKLQGRWTPLAEEAKPQSLKLSLRLDDADRSQLGLDLDRLVRGEVPIEVTVSRTGSEAAKVRVHADLMGAELMLDEIHWRKPPGRPARLDFDVGKGTTAKGFELQNFRVDGENLAIDGWVSIGPDNKAREFMFPEFLVNVVSNLEVQGTLRPDRVWDVKVRGKSPFDAGDLFRGMLALNQDTSKPAKDRPGLDLSAEFDTVLGLNETRLKQVRLKLQKRNDLLVGVDMRSMFESGRPLTAMLRSEPGKPRVLRIESTDAGAALKLIGFYQNMVGGNGRLDINLDGRGAAERQGQVTIGQFRVLGDAIASEVFQAPDDSRPLIDQARPGRRVLREQFDFELLVAGFSIGNGQLVIHNALARGPLIGASLLGKIDFRTRRVDLGGTYVPLSGLSRAFGEIPVLGPLLTGPRGEGVLGITFLVQGPMANPQVIVNPLSLMTLGFTRELMQMTPDNPSITPRADVKKAIPKGAGPQIRASPPSEARPGAVAPGAEPVVIDGWSTEAKGAPAVKKSKK
jgi:hypothetical protein